MIAATTYVNGGEPGQEDVVAGFWECTWIQDFHSPPAPGRNRLLSFTDAITTSILPRMKVLNVPTYRRFILAVAAALGLLLSVGAGTAFAATSAPSTAAHSVAVHRVAEPEAPVYKVTLCLAISKAYCANVPGGNNKSGQAIYLRNTGAAKAAHWYQVGVYCPGQAPGAPQCFTFSDSANTNLCLGSNAARNVVLMGCSAAEAAWVSNANGRIRNASWGPLGDLAVAGPKNSNYLYTSAVNDGDTGWTGQKVCSGC